MNELELQEKVYEGVIELAVSLTQQGKTMTSEELIEWIQHYAGFQHPYGNSRGVPQAAFLRAKTAGNHEGMDALVKAFTHSDGSPLWQESETFETFYTEGGIRAGINLPHRPKCNNNNQTSKTTPFIFLYAN